jgi:hypothetical protein
MTEQKENATPLEWAPWDSIDEFLKKEKDSTRSSVTHVKLAFAAILIISILLSIYSFLGALAKISELKGEQLSDGEALFVLALALTIGLILLVIAFVLQKIRRSLVASLEEELKRKAEAVLHASKRFDITIPPTTARLLEGMR